MNYDLRRTERSNPRRSLLDLYDLRNDDLAAQSEERIAFLH
jgi:hypothetical protein